MDPTNIPRKLIGPEDERAVSPVIGVILMVAITVILAAVIAAFVLDIGPGDSTISAAADVSDDGTDISVEITSGGGDIDGLAIVDDTGTVVAVTEESVTVSTGGTYHTDDTDGHFDEGDEPNIDELGEYTVYGFSGSVSADGDDNSIDDADAHVNLGSGDL